ncbi:sulfatase family protein [Chitinophaga alhagiae]|uniref:sulfatase family protein n=1 Tax=Chitinophaga alhagiae TaxID=2203219 RepID=UPI000E5B7F8F|nr:arylsulfatase [Chitinophaga alhagiae]
MRKTVFGPGGWLPCILLLGAVSIAACGQAPGGKTAQATPNIVFILADDMGYGDVHCFNPNGKIATPHMDKLAEQGMKFTNAHSSSAVCTPSRYSVLTGRYAWRTRLQKGVLYGYSPPLIDSNRLTVAAMLREKGYFTAAIGKWHLGLDWQLKGQADSLAKTGWEIDYSQPIQHGPLSLGFDYFFGISASLDMPPYVFIENDKATAIPAVSKKWVREGPAAADFEAENVLPVITGKAKQVMASRASGEQPFFLYFALPSPHTPIVPDSTFKGKSGVTDYGDYMMETDWAVGQVMQALDSLGIADNTLVIVTSDNGFAPYVLKQFDVEALGHQPSYTFRGYKADIWEGGHRVPFIARWPAQVKAGTASDNVISLTDFMATCADITASALPDNAAEDSYSILRYLKGSAGKQPREAIVFHSIDGNFSIQEGNWKLILGAGSGGWAAPKNKDALLAGLPAVQLYDMEKDAAEKVNEEAAHPEIVQRLTALLEKYIAEGRSTDGANRRNDVEVDIWKRKS